MKTSEPDQENSYKTYSRKFIVPIDNIATKKCYVQSKISVTYYAYYACNDSGAMRDPSQRLSVSYYCTVW